MAGLALLFERSEIQKFMSMKIPQAEESATNLKILFICSIGTHSYSNLH